MSTQSSCMERHQSLSAPEIKRGMVSVLIPCHEHGHFLPEAIGSVLRQTYPLIEIIIVNDGSTDNTHQIGMDYADRYPDRIIYFQQECQGQAIARRKAAALAKGEFWITLDADDIIEPTMVEKSVQALRSNSQAAVAVSDVWIVDASGRVILDRLKQNKIPIWPDILSHNPLGGIAGIMLRADAIAKVGGLAHEGLPGAEDWDLWIRLARSRQTFVHIPDFLARYRQTSNSHSRKPVDVLLGTLQVLDKLTQDDPRLSQISNPHSPINDKFYQLLRNRAVFFAYGVAIASNSNETTLNQILSYLLPNSLETKRCAQSLIGGVNKVLGQTPRAENPSVYLRAIQYLDNYLAPKENNTVVLAIKAEMDAEQLRRRRVYLRWDRVWRKRLNNLLATVWLNTREWHRA